MHELFQMCILGYMLVGIVWWLVEVFMFESTTMHAILRMAVWPIIVWRVKRGRRKLPGSFYSAGPTHSEFKKNHSEESKDHQAIKEEEAKDERDKGGDPA